MRRILRHLTSTTSIIANVSRVALLRFGNKLKIANAWIIGIRIVSCLESRNSDNQPSEAHNS